jgi:hypothetical protein
VTDSARAIRMLAVLAAIALVLAVLVSLLPVEWQEGPVPSPALIFTRGPANGRGRVLPPAASETPLPVITPTTQDGTGRLIRPDADPFAPGFAVLGIRRDSLGGFTVRLATLITLLIAGMVLLFLMPRRVGRIAAEIRGGWSWLLRLGLLGLAAVLLMGAFGVLSVITLAGTPIWLAVGALGYFGALIGIIGLSLPLGRWIGYRFGLAAQSPPIDLLAGLLGVFILNVLPFVGGLVLLVIGLLGLGVVLQTRAGSEHPWTAALPDIEY